MSDPVRRGPKVYETFSLTRLLLKLHAFCCYKKKRLKNNYALMVSGSTLWVCMCICTCVLWVCVRIAWGHVSNLVYLIDISANTLSCNFCNSVLFVFWGRKKKKKVGEDAITSMCWKPGTTTGSVTSLKFCQNRPIRSWLWFLFCVHFCCALTHLCLCLKPDLKIWNQIPIDDFFFFPLFHLFVDVID